mmetsp:Transcript_23126/g.50517  ORF Transcript_23126/g.50517 Transcript_23126/m.50517 type:complete len:681 (-) Transcript_23126:342-2384(-)
MSMSLSLFITIRRGSCALKRRATRSVLSSSLSLVTVAPRSGSTRGFVAASLSSPVVPSTTSIPTRKRRTSTVSTSSGRCFFSTTSNRNNNNNNNKRFDLRALPFSVSPEEALQSFRKWADDDQGLRYITNHDSIKIAAAFVPVWTFDLNLRFKQQQPSKNSSSSSRSSSPSLYSWKPSVFEGYDRAAAAERSSSSSRTDNNYNYNNDVVYLPGGIAAYAGYSYRRSLINPVHSTTLIFMGGGGKSDATQPFGAWMLRDMVLKETGNPIRVVPDVWNSTQGQAFAVVKEELQEIVNQDWNNNTNNNTNTNTNTNTPPPVVQTEVVASRRVFMPTFVIEYSIFGLEYQAFVSGCDTSAPVGGVSHQIFENNNGSSSTNNGIGLSPEFYRSSRNLLARLSGGVSQVLKNVPITSLPVLVSVVVRPLFSTAWFVLIRLAGTVTTAAPIVGVAGGLFAGFRKVLQPWMDNQKASADWERQRRHEAEMAQNEHQHHDRAASGNNKYKYESKPNNTMNDFHDFTGRARKFFDQNKESILRSLSGGARHEEGDFDWYSDWQAWAQQQWEQQAKQQQQQQHYNQRHQNYRQRQRATNARKTDDPSSFRWPFDPGDPYSVLGIDDRRNVTDAEVSNAFRKQMLRYHPDTQPNATSQAQKRRYTERSKLITEAYRTIKTDRKNTKHGKQSN